MGEIVPLRHSREPAGPARTENLRRLDQTRTDSLRRLDETRTESLRRLDETRTDSLRRLDRGRTANLRRLDETPAEPLWRELVGDQLRTVRHDRGERLVDVAERAGVSPQYLSEVERGLKDPSSEMLAAVAGSLDLTVRQLTVRAARSAGQLPGATLLLAA